jgi:hypothetical protein
VIADAQPGPFWPIGPIVLGIGIVLLVSLTVGVNAWLRREGYITRGVVVMRCPEGHLFRTKWWFNFRAVDIWFMRRYQYCPVGDHWAVVRAVKEKDLTETERQNIYEGDDHPPPPAMWG